MKFAHVKSGAVQQWFNKLPFTFAGVRRFHSLSDGERAALGVLPVVRATPFFEPPYERLSREEPQSIAIFPDRVEVTQLVIEVSLSEAKALKRAELRATLLRKLDEGADDAGGTVWGTDFEARTDLSTALVAFNSGTPFPANFRWPNRDGELAPLASVAALALVLRVVVTHLYQTRLLYAQKLQQLRMAVSVGEIKSITWV